MKQWECYAIPAATGKKCGHINTTGRLSMDGIICCESCGCTKKASDDREKRQNYTEEEGE